MPGSAAAASSLRMRSDGSIVMVRNRAPIPFARSPTRASEAPPRLGSGSPVLTLRTRSLADCPYCSRLALATSHFPLGRRVRPGATVGRAAARQGEPRSPVVRRSPGTDRRTDALEQLASDRTEHVRMSAAATAMMALSQYRTNAAAQPASCICVTSVTRTWQNIQCATSSGSAADHESASIHARETSRLQLPHSCSHGRTTKTRIELTSGKLG